MPWDKATLESPAVAESSSELRSRDTGAHEAEIEASVAGLTSAIDLVVTEAISEVPNMATDTCKLPRKECKRIRCDS